MKVTERRSQEARAKAEKNFTQSAQRDVAFIKERERIKTINEEKTARLRGLRLAKEAAEREVAEKLAAEKAANPRKTKSKAKAGPTDAPADQPAAPAVALESPSDG